MSQKAVAAVLAGIGLTLLVISGLGFILLSQSTQVADSEGQARSTTLDDRSSAPPPLASVATDAGNGVAIQAPIDFGASDEAPASVLFTGADEPAAKASAR